MVQLLIENVKFRNFIIPGKNHEKKSFLKLFIVRIMYILNKKNSHSKDSFKKNDSNVEFSYMYQWAASRLAISTKMNQGTSPSNCFPNGSFVKIPSILSQSLAQHIFACKYSEIIGEKSKLFQQTAVIVNFPRYWIATVFNFVKEYPNAKLNCQCSFYVFAQKF